MKGLKGGFWGGNGLGGEGLVGWLVGSAQGLVGGFGREIRGVFLGR